MATGDCPWCDKKAGVLHLIAARIEGQLTGDYVCAECLVRLDALRREKTLSNNPEVQISEVH